MIRLNLATFVMAIFTNSKGFQLVVGASMRKISDLRQGKSTYSQQKIFPHDRQWCLLKKVWNGCLHPKQESASLSSIHVVSPHPNAVGGYSAPSRFVHSSGSVSPAAVLLRKHLAFRNLGLSVGIAHNIGTFSSSKITSKALCGSPPQYTPEIDAENSVKSKMRSQTFLGIKRNPFGNDRRCGRDTNSTKCGSHRSHKYSSKWCSCTHCDWTCHLKVRIHKTQRQTSAEVISFEPLSSLKLTVYQKEPGYTVKACPEIIKQRDENEATW